MTVDVLAPPLPAPRRRRRAKPVPPDWACDNCATPNAGRRRRCADCGTLRC